MRAFVRFIGCSSAGYEDFFGELLEKTLVHLCQKMSKFIINYTH